MDPKVRFTDTVDRYHQFRPDYPLALFDWLEQRCGRKGRAADLGAGTGIFSRMLHQRGWDVVGVEPNQAMRGRAELAGGLVYQDGSAEATGLADGSFNLVTGAQAFHWFDLDRVIPEIRRISAPGALAAAIWNVRTERGFAAAYDAVLTAFSPSYRTVPKPQDSVAALQACLPDATIAHFSHGQHLDREAVLGRAWSSSYVQHGVTDRVGFDAAMLAAFDAHTDGDLAWLGYETVVVAWWSNPTP